MAIVLLSGELSGTIGAFSKSGTGILTGNGSGTGILTGKGTTFFTRIGTGNSLTLGINKGLQLAEAANRAIARRAIVTYMLEGII